MNWVSMIPEAQRKEAAASLRQAADAVEQGDGQKAVGELLFVLGIVVGLMKTFGLDPTQLLHKGVDWVIAKIPTMIDRARGK